MSKSDPFENHIISAYKAMIKKGRVMESGTIVLDEDNKFSFKIQKLAAKKRGNN